jgi:hypothetical protein
MITTGPSGKISIDFNTGSVVVPLISETTESFWFVTAFTTLDFHAFVQPKKDICGLSDFVNSITIYYHKEM